MVRLRPYHLLALLPTAAILGGVPFASRVRGTVFGLPFLLVWIVACVLATSVVMAVIGALDRRASGRAGSGPEDRDGA